jgi:hypothetical protein
MIVRNGLRKTDDDMVLVRCSQAHRHENLSNQDEPAAMAMSANPGRKTADRAAIAATAPAGRRRQKADQDEE